jgi:hypothetical protein
MFLQVHYNLVRFFRMKSLLQYFYIPMFAIVGKENGQLDYRWIQIPNGLDHRG